MTITSSQTGGFTSAPFLLRPRSRFVQSLLPAVLRRGVLPAPLPFDRSSLTRWRQRMGEEKLAALIQESLAVATRTGAAKPADFSKVIVDTTVQPKAVAFPDRRQADASGARAAGEAGEENRRELRQSYERVGKLALIAHQRYAHAKQFKRANRALRTLRTYLGRVIRDIVRKIGGDAAWRAPSPRRSCWPRGCASSASTARTEGLLAACARGRMHRQGQGASALRVRRQGRVATTLHRSQGGQFVAHVKALPGNPYDGHTLATVIPEIEAQIGVSLDPHRRRPRLSRPQRPARPQVQGLYLRAEAPRHRGHQTRVAPPLRRRAGHRPCQGGAPHGPQLPRRTHGDAANAVLAAAGYNFRRLLEWLALLSSAILTALKTAATQGAVQIGPRAFFTGD